MVILFNIHTMIGKKLNCNFTFNSFHRIVNGHGIYFKGEI